MVKITIGVEGMACSMCEAHVNDAIRRAFNVKKVTSSHAKKRTEIICENDISEAEIRKAIKPTGYRVLSVKSEPYEKKGLFGLKK